MTVSIQGTAPQACRVRQGAYAGFEKSNGKDITRCQVHQTTRKHKRCGMQTRTIRLLRMFLVVGLWTLWLAAAATAAVPTVPGMSYDSVSYADFIPYDSSVVKNVSWGLGAYATGGLLSAKTDLPHGAFVYDLTVWGGAGGLVSLRRANHDSWVSNPVATVALPAGTGLVSKTYALPTPSRIDTGQASYHLQIVSTTAATAILSVGSATDWMRVISITPPPAQARVLSSILIDRAGALSPMGSGRSLATARG